MDDKTTRKIIISTIILVVGIVFSISAITTMSTSKYKMTTETAYALAANSSSLSSNNTPSKMQNMIKVEVGTGNASAIIDRFFPQTVEIKVGQSITWYNPTQVAEPHTVTFALDNKTMTRPVAPVAINPNSTQFMPIPPDSNNEPVKVPGGKSNNAVVVVALNARSFIPTVIDSQGSVKHFAPNAAYTMDGTEKYVNSGWLLPKGDEQEFPGSGNTFTVTFQKAGTFNYVCILHPWMQGSVVVK
jgi:plastocyanin